MEKEFDIEIKEVLSRVETVKAESLDDAINKAMDMYYSEQIVLDAEDMKGVDFFAIQRRTAPFFIKGKWRKDTMKNEQTAVIKDMEFLLNELHKEWERPGEVKSSVSIPYEKVEEISRKLNVIVYETQQSADSDGLAFKQSIAKSKQCYVLLRIMRKIVKGKGKCDRQAVDAEFVIELDGEESKLFKEMFAELLK